MKITRLMKSVPLVLIAVGLIQASALGQKQASGARPAPAEVQTGYQKRLAEVAAQYGSEGWQASPRRAGLPLGELEFPGFVGEDVYSSAGHIERRFCGADDLLSFNVEAKVCDNVPAAHAVMLEWLAGLSSLAPAPSAAELGFAVGDVGYAGLSGAAPGAISWIAFSRANVAVRVSVDEVHAPLTLDMQAISREVDRQVMLQTELGPKQALPRPVVRRLEVQQANCVAGDVLAIDLDVQDAEGEPAAITWTVNGPGQGYVERRDDGVFRLYTTGPGRIELSVQVTGRLGVSSVASLVAIEVEDD
ncbi:MAG: hypothetical protein V2A76_11080 [Planctomycetota bacterium]